MNEFWSYLGQGIGLFLLCMGIGGCYYLCQKKDPTVPLISITQVVQTNTPAK